MVSDLGNWFDGGACECPVQQDPRKTSTAQIGTDVCTHTKTHALTCKGTKMHLECGSGACSHRF